LRRYSSIGGSTKISGSVCSAFLCDYAYFNTWAVFVCCFLATYFIWTNRNFIFLRCRKPTLFSCALHRLGQEKWI